MVAIDLARYADTLRQLPMRGIDLASACEEDLKEAGVTVGVHRRRHTYLHTPNDPPLPLTPSSPRSHPQYLSAIHPIFDL